MEEERCVCGHIQQNEGPTWKMTGGIHSVSMHIGHCKSSKCKECNPKKYPDTLWGHFCWLLGL